MGTIGAEAEERVMKKEWGERGGVPLHHHKLIQRKKRPYSKLRTQERGEEDCEGKEDRIPAERKGEGDAGSSFTMSSLDLVW